MAWLGLAYLVGGRDERNLRIVCVSQPPRQSSIFTFLPSFLPTFPPQIHHISLTHTPLSTMQYVPDLHSLVTHADLTLFPRLLRVIISLSRTVLPLFITFFNLPSPILTSRHVSSSHPIAYTHHLSHYFPSFQFALHSNSRSPIYASISFSPHILYY